MPEPGPELFDPASLVDPWRLEAALGSCSCRPCRAGTGAPVSTLPSCPVLVAVWWLQRASRTVARPPLGPSLRPTAPTLMVPHPTALRLALAPALAATSPQPTARHLTPARALAARSLSHGTSARRALTPPPSPPSPPPDPSATTPHPTAPTLMGTHTTALPLVPALALAATSTLPTALRLALAPALAATRPQPTARHLVPAQALEVRSPRLEVCPVASVSRAAMAWGQGCS